MTATAVKKYYRPGLLFKAHQKAQGHQECCFPGAPEIRNPDGSLQREQIRPLWAEFGVFGSEFSWENEATGETGISAEIRGGWFDLDAQAEAKGWTDTEKEIVARHMLTLPPGHAQFTLHSLPPAVAPWPTYDETPHGKIVELAVALGLADAALTYEEQNKARKTVVDGLKAALAAPTVEDEELTAA